MKGNMRFCVPCLFGVEGLVAQELRDMGLEQVQAENGRVLFSGGWEAMARANLCCRFGERVLLLLGEFPARSFEELFQGVKALPWEGLLGKEDAFPVTGSSLSSQLHSVPDCQAIIKKAIVERLKAKYKLSWFAESGALHRVRFRILKDQVSVMVDTSGEGLHKRGYRALSNDAPMKETLAASLCQLSRLRQDGHLIDPFCGSGTILIEGALLARNIAPGLGRAFTAESWGSVPGQLWQQERERARSLERRDTGFTAQGFDVDPRRRGAHLGQRPKGQGGGLYHRQRPGRAGLHPRGRLRLRGVQPALWGAPAGCAPGPGAVPGPGAGVPAPAWVELGCHQPRPGVRVPVRPQGGQAPQALQRHDSVPVLPVFQGE